MVRVKQGLLEAAGLALDWNLQHSLKDRVGFIIYFTLITQRIYDEKRTDGESKLTCV